MHLELEAALKLRDLARELLDDRDQQRIFFAIHFDDTTPAREVGEQAWLDQPADRPNLQGLSPYSRRPS